MSYFLTSRPLRTGIEATVIGEEAAHIAQARRIKVGEHINLQGPDLRRFNTQVIAVDRRVIKVKVLEEIAVPPEPTLQIVLFQALVHEQALDYILQKSTELGAARIVLFNAVRTPTRFEGEKLLHKLERWKKILDEAAKQCDRLRGPELEFRVSFEEVVEKVKTVEQLFVLDQSGAPFPSPDLRSPSPLGRGQGEGLALLVGPEGGFTPEELSTLKTLPNATAVRLGPRILRTETAATAAIAIVQALYGDM